jgi:hypothetical protein
MKVRRAAAVAIVLGAALTAWALTPASDGTLVATPTIGVALQPGGAGSSATFALSTPGSTNVIVSQLVQDAAGCPDPTVTLASYAGFTAMPGVPHTETVMCPPTSAFGMRRCTYQALAQGSAALTGFMGVCLAWTSSALVADQGTLAFINVPIGTMSAPQTIQITNTGADALAALQLQIDNDLANDYVLGAPCASNVNGCDVPEVALPHGGTASVAVYCKPTVANPPAARLWVTMGGATLASPISLSCTTTAASGPVVSVATLPSPLDVGRVEILGGATGSGHVIVKNIGTSTLTIPGSGGIAINGGGSDWTYALSAPCTAGQSCDLPVGTTNDILLTFDPSRLGASAPVIAINSNATNGQQTASLTGTGTGATLEDLRDGAAVDFGLVPKTMTSSIAIHLDNRGNRDLTDATITLTPATGFSVSTTNPVTVPYGTGKDVMVTCSPNGSTTPLVSTLTAMAPDTFNNTSVSIMLTCTGTDSPLVASPGSVALGEIRTGSTPPPTTLELKNLSTSQLTLSQGSPMLMPTIPALALSSPASTTIAAHSQEAVELTVTTAADSDLTTAIVASDRNSDMLTIPVTGKLVTAAVSVPSTVDLGTFCVNQPTMANAIALTASGTGTVGLPSAPAMQLHGNSQFALAPTTPSTYPARLVPGESAVVEVKPRPQTMRMQVADAIVWATDLAGPTATTMVSASFLDDGAAIAPASLTFGPVPVHVQPHDAMAVTIQNCSTTPLAFSPVIDQPFSFDNAAFPTALMPGQTATFGVAFVPTKVMHYDGYLRIMSTPTTQQMLVVALSGDGVADNPGGDAGPGGGGLDHTSFYACSCTAGGPGGALPIGAALALVICRRRRGSSSAR